MDPDYIAREIATKEALIEQLRRKIEELHRQIEYLLQEIRELQCSAIFDQDGEISCYADWAA